MEIKETKPVWVTYTNSDLTEGRGRSIPLFVCESEVTARRLGKGKYVMGSDCPVQGATAIKIGQSWLVPGIIEPESAQDKAIRERAEAKASVIQKMKDSGFSEEEISALK